MESTDINLFNEINSNDKLKLVSKIIEFFQNMLNTEKSNLLNFTTNSESDNDNKIVTENEDD